MPSENNNDNAISQNTFRSGLNTDTAESFKPKESYNYALNAILESSTGDKGSITNEHGNLLCISLPNNYKILDACLLTNEEFLIFSTDNINSEIGLFKSNTCLYTTLINNTCLDFNTAYPISSLFRIKNGCDRIVYFTDNKNKYRSINIDDLSTYYDSSNNFICNRLNFSSDLLVPKITNKKLLNSGGSLKYGAYQFAIRYLDKNLNPTNWLFTTDSFYVYDESLGGPKNIISSSNEIGVYPPTNKSIELNISNLDTTFTYYQYAIIEYVSGTGVISNVKLSDNLPITNNNWIYTGENTIGTTNITDIVVNKVTIEKVKTHTQIDNRLYLASTTSLTDIDYATIQRAAMNITSTCRLIEDVVDLETGDKKFIKTYMKDEVYAFAISGILDNGDLLPAFHIPGRKTLDSTSSNFSTYSPKFNNNWDNASWIRTRPDYIPNGSGLWDLYDLNTATQPPNTNFAGDSLFLDKPSPKWWEAYNSSFIINYDSTTLSNSEVYMAYWQSTELYPMIKDCNNINVFGSDAGTPIRHHKFPDTSIVPRHSVAIEFDLNTFISSLPSDITSKVKEWKIMQALRTEENKTVLDKGITTIREINNYYYGRNIGLANGGDEFNFSSSTPPSYNTTTSDFRMLRFYSPKTLFKKEYLNGTHLKIESLNWLKEYKPNLFNNGPLVDSFTDAVNGHLDIWLGVSISKAQISTFIPTQFFYYPYNIKLETSVFINTPDNNITPGSVAGLIPNTNPEASINRNYTPHVFQLKAEQIKKITNPTNVPVDGTGDLSNWNPFIIYASIKDNKNVYSNLYLNTYFIPENQVRTGNKILVKGGDSFITAFSFEISARGLDQINHVSISDRVSRNIHFIIAESDINTSVRHSTLTNPFFDLTTNAADDKCGSFYSGSYYKSLLQFSTFAQIVSYYDFDGNFNLGDFTCKEYFGYNLDFSVHHPLKVYQALSYNYDYCSNCINKFPYRIYYSDKDFQETSTDNYKSIKENNYIDLDGSTGNLNILFKDKNNLYAITDKSLYLIPTNPQTLQSNENTVYIGTGEVFSVPPRRISTVDFNYSGSNQIESLKTTEMGTLYVDEQNGKVYHLSEGLEELSQKNMSSFFKTYLPLQLKKQLQQLQILDVNSNQQLINFHSTVDNYSTGIKSIYEPYYKRWYLIKKDFKLTEEGVDLLTSTNVSNQMIFNTSLKQFQVTQGMSGFVVEDLNEYPSLFENISWTISYDFKNQCWDSFHSFIPYQGFNNSKNFFTLVDSTHFRRNDEKLDSIWNKSNLIWVHNNEAEYQKYYNKKFDYILDFTLNESPFITKTFDTINLYSKTSLYEPSTKQEVENRYITFDRTLVYTNSQTTGTQISTVIGENNAFDNLLNSSTVLTWKQYEKNLSLSNIRDYSIFAGQSVITGDYLNQLDNDININLNKSIFETERIRDKTANIRLFFKPISNLKITTDLVATKTQTSYR